MLVYIIGRTIKNEMKTESSFEVSHISARTIKDATGTDFTVIIKGQSRSSIIGSLAAIIASIIPKTSPDKNPQTILRKLFETAGKKPSSCQIVKSLETTPIGVGKRKLSFTIIAAICQTVKANSTAIVRLKNLFFSIIEIVCGHCAAY